MADFVQTMNDWRRMCQAQDDGSDRDVCATCPLELGCTAIYEGGMDYAHVEEVVTKWVAEHPQPVYPTWGEWLESAHIVNPDPDAVCNQHLLKAWYYDSYIPADIAQKLGLQPKEGQCAK